MVLGHWPTSAPYGDFTDIEGIPGQNTDWPSQKAFNYHIFVKYAAGAGTNYYDPSYGLTYSNNVDFVKQVVGFYGYQDRSDPEATNRMVLRLDQPVPGKSDFLWIDDH
jgi:hypothetical protein